jgi:cell division protein FtsN
MNEFHEEDEEYFCRFTFGQFVSLSLLELVALFFVFYLGARYGPGLLGYKSIETENEDAASEVEEIFQLPQSPSGQVRFTFPETLTRKEELIVPQPPVTATPAPAKPPVMAAPQPTPTVVPEPTPVPPVPKVETAGPAGYSVQVGSYRQASGAAEKVNQWQAKGYDAFLSIGEVPNSGTWYRVRIGNFKSRESARQLLEHISKEEKVSAIIVRSNS